MADNKPTFHHMNDSQSQRILWLLEELGIEYNLVLHERNAASHPTAPWRSPPSLLSTGLYGTAPVLFTGAKDGNRYIPESSAIATYLIRTFDTEDKFGLRNGDWIRDEVLCSLDATNLNRATGMKMFLEFGMMRNGGGPGAGAADGPLLRKVLGQLETELKEGPEGGFFMGKEPGRADIMIEFHITVVKHRRWVDLPREFPALDAWLQKVYDRPAFKRSLEKGNGYDCSKWGRKEKL